ncbi:MAG: acyl-[acyl-carrier-protein]--UDP-N-acetylglucosamine O-acyltransferase, partial [candidate division WOR-3 bacterium]
MAKISSWAKVSKKAIIEEEVIIHPFAVIEDNVKIGKGTEIFSHVIILKGTEIGENNKIYPGCV